MTEFRRQRDNQQWIYDWVVGRTGRPMNFEYESRYYPPSVKTHAMIPKHMSRIAAHRAAIAQHAEEAGHHSTAIELYWDAVDSYYQAEHAAFDEPLEKRRLYYTALEQCYDRIIALSPYRIERLEVPWEGHSIACLFHHTGPVAGGGCVLSIPGMDRAKEHWYHPNQNIAGQRGLHVVTMDGPGQGSSCYRGDYVDHDNYERAAATVIEYLRERPEIDADKVAVFGSSFGTHWAVRTAALSSQVAAMAVAAPVFGSKRPIFDQAPPRFKQVFMHMAGMDDEAAFDAMAAMMDTSGYGREIDAPALIITGEYDPLSPLGEAESLFGELAGSKELWILEDQFHVTRKIPNLANLDVFRLSFDWLADILYGRRDLPFEVRRTIPPSGGLGPYT